MGNSGIAAAKRKASSLNLAELLDDGNYEYNFQPSSLELSNINVLAQPRKTFENIALLAEDLAAHQLLHPVIVAEFDRGYCERYLSAINDIWHSDYDIDQLTSTQTAEGERYYVLVAGERRYRAFSYLWFEGCMVCREKGRITPGKCFRKHFRTGKIEVRLARNIPPLQALYRQLAENTHERVAPHEEAIAIGETYALLKQRMPEISPSALAREIGMGVGKVSAAVAYFALPESIKIATAAGTISYGIALQLARLNEDGESEDSLHRWATHAIVNGVHRRVVDFRDLVDAYLLNKHSGQVGLFDEETEEQTKRQRNYRQVVARNFVASYHLVIQYFTTVEDRFDDGTLGAADSPFSISSPIKAIRKALNHFERVLLHLKRYLPAKERVRATVVVAELTEALVVQEQGRFAEEKIDEILRSLSSESRIQAELHIEQLVQLLSGQNERREAQERELAITAVG
ncbi:MAG: hypothetical protein Q8P13_02310 [bacterium]|nr:hypothetical protein [bacterium]